MQHEFADEDKQLNTNLILYTWCLLGHWSPFYLLDQLIVVERSKVARGDYTNTRINLFHMSFSINQRHHTVSLKGATVLHLIPTQKGALLQKHSL